jgi:hypothetical protein
VRTEPDTAASIDGQALEQDSDHHNASPENLDRPAIASNAEDVEAIVDDVDEPTSLASDIRDAPAHFDSNRFRGVSSIEGSPSQDHSTDNILCKTSPHSSGHEATALCGIDSASDAEAAYIKSGGSFKMVVLSLLTSDSFIYRKKPIQRNE